MRRFACRAVLFDLDGVLVDSTETIRRNWWRWAAGHGLDAEAVVRAAQGRRTLETVRLVAPHLDPEAELAALAADEASETAGVREVPGAKALVTALPPGNWAVVTSALRSAALLRLRHVGLPVPDVLVAADEVEAGKPHPEGYLAAAARLGVPAGQCVVVEDSPPGVEAARAGGLRVIAVATSHAAFELGAADAIASSLAAIRVTFHAGVLELEIPEA